MYAMYLLFFLIALLYPFLSSALWTFLHVLNNVIIIIIVPEGAHCSSRPEELQYPGEERPYMLPV